MWKYIAHTCMSVSLCSHLTRVHVSGLICPSLYVFLWVWQTCGLKKNEFSLWYILYIRSTNPPLLPTWQRPELFRIKRLQSLRHRRSRGHGISISLFLRAGSFSREYNTRHNRKQPQGVCFEDNIWNALWLQYVVLIYTSSSSRATLSFNQRQVWSLQTPEGNIPTRL